MLMRHRRDINVWIERICHTAAIALSVTSAFLLRLDFSIPASLTPVLKQALLIAILMKLPAFEWAGFYRGLRRFVSIPDLYRMFLGNLAGSVLFTAVSRAWIGPAMPRFLWPSKGWIFPMTCSVSSEDGLCHPRKSEDLGQG